LKSPPNDCFPLDADWTRGSGLTFGTHNFRLRPDISGSHARSTYNLPLRPDISGSHALSPHKIRLRPDISGSHARSSYKFRLRPDIFGSHARSSYKFRLRPDIFGSHARSPHKIRLRPDISGSHARSPHKIRLRPDISGSHARSPHKIRLRPDIYFRVSRAFDVRHAVDCARIILTPIVTPLTMASQCRSYNGIALTARKRAGVDDVGTNRLLAAGFIANAAQVAIIRKHRLSKNPGAGIRLAAAAAADPYVMLLRRPLPERCSRSARQQ